MLAYNVVFVSSLLRTYKVEAIDELSSSWRCERKPVLVRNFDEDRCAIFGNFCLVFWDFMIA